MLLFFVIATLVSSNAVVMPGMPMNGHMGLPMQQPPNGIINGCTSQRLDGNTIAKMNMAECQRKTAESTNIMLQKANESATIAFNKEIAKGPNSKEGAQCIEKATQGTDRCMLAGIIDGVVKKPRFNLAEKANLTVLYDRKTPVAARVNVNYKIMGIETPQEVEKTIVDYPSKRKLYYNEIGQVIAAEGDFTPDDKEDACKPCEPVKKTIETYASKCNLGCQLRGTSALVSRSIQKKEVKRIKNGDKENNDPNRVYIGSEYPGNKD